MDDTQAYIWIASHLKQITKLASHINYSLQDDLVGLAIDCTPEVYSRYSEVHNVPLDRYILHILRKRFIAYCVSQRAHSVQHTQLHNNIPDKTSSTQNNNLSYYIDKIVFLSNFEKECYLMYILEDKTFQQIAIQLNSSEPTVRRTYWAAFWRIRKTTHDSTNPTTT